MAGDEEDRVTRQLSRDELRSRQEQDDELASYDGRPTRQHRHVRFLDSEEQPTSEHQHPESFDDEDETSAIVYPPVREELAQLGEPYLAVISGSPVRELIRVVDRLTVGRGGLADLRIDDSGLSRLHFELRRASDGLVTLIDRKSRNGTYVNEKRVDRVILSDGDRIMVGATTVLKFTHGDKLEENFQRELYDSAVRDPLTGLYNRRHLHAQLTTEQAYSRRHGTELSLVLFDLDRFKSVNDRWGHPVGDRVLVAFAELVRRVSRTEDVAYRYGGEEFALLCRGTDAPGARRLAERIRVEVAREPLLPDIPELELTVSAGVAQATLPLLDAPELLVEAADQALYRSKQLGRDRVCTSPLEE